METAKNCDVTGKNLDIDGWNWYSTHRIGISAVNIGKGMDLSRMSPVVVV